MGAAGFYDITSGQFLDADDVGVLLGAYEIGATQRAMVPQANMQQFAQPGYGSQLANSLANRGGQQFQQFNPNLQAMQIAQAQKLAQGSTLLRSMQPTKARVQVLGMKSDGTIAAGGSATITARPQTFAFKPERIVIPATVGPNFTIQDIKVGNISQLVQSGDLPAEAFAQNADGVTMDMDTVQTSQDFIIQVTNISGQPVTFRAMILGKSANG